MSSVLPFPIPPSRAPEVAPKALRARKPHHTGHRERLRDRARGAGLPHLPDYELLELFLFRSQPQGDVKPIAKALLARFGSLAAVLAAPVEDLMTVKAEDTKGRMKGIGTETAPEGTAVTFYGSSFIADQTGQLVAKASRDTEELLIATFDLDAIADLRRSWGLFRDRRPETYRALGTLDGRL